MAIIARTSVLTAIVVPTSCERNNAQARVRAAVSGTWHTAYMEAALRREGRSACLLR